MTRAKISEYSATANDNTDVNGIDIAEGCPPSSMNNMGREIMAALKRFQVGSDGDGVTVGGSLVVSGSTTIANTATLGNVDINGGAIDGTTIGGASAAAVTATTMSATVVQSDTISEKTSATGVTIDGVLLKDSGVVTGAGTVSAPVYSTTGDLNTGIFFPAADTIAFAEGGAEAMRIDSSGNVGIGTTSPGNSLQVSRAGADVARFTNTQSNGGDWQFKIGGGGFEDRRLMITDRFSGADNVRVGIDSNGNFQFNSGYGSAAVAYGCRAWVNFDGTGTPAIREDGNVSSITDDGTGSYTVNFTTAMPDANYCVSLSSDTNASGGLNAFSAGAPTTSGVPVYTFGVAGGGAGAYRDTSRIYVAIFR